ncbi:hypothetical protein [Pulveribacter sp.]|uniref:hypothetical protein n=1 Tax=Pulveribacter sp. TaxID=2678893 RepID=UPI0028B064F0|nr:hypothetical protein [Pulveribacter sp.]
MTPRCLLLAAALLAMAGCAAPTHKPEAMQSAPAVGCSPPPPPAVPRPPEPEPEPVEEPLEAPRESLNPALQEALQYADHVRGADAPALAAEISSLDQAKDGPPERRLSLALALMHTRQPADTARALGLTQRVLEDGALAALHPLARLLEERLLQQRRLEEQLDRQSRQLREAQQRNEQLSERLEAMRTLERSLNAPR